MPGPTFTVGLLVPLLHEYEVPPLAVKVVVAFEHNEFAPVILGVSDEATVTLKVSLHIAVE